MTLRPLRPNVRVPQGQTHPDPRPGRRAVSGGPSSGCGSFPGTYRYPRTHRRTCYLSQSARGGRSEGTHGTSDPARRNRRGRETRRPDEAGEPAPLRGRFSHLRHPEPLSGNSRAAEGVPTIHSRQDIASGLGSYHSATTDHPAVGNADQHGSQGRIFRKPRDEPLLYAGPIDNYCQRRRNRTHELPAAGERMRHSAILPRKKSA